MKADLLVIGYGNELRGDDGVGPAAARAVAGWNLPGVRALALHQLTPETADEVGQAGCVVFVDAAVGTDVLEVRELSEESGPRATHASDPGAVLTLARLLHGRRPRAWLIAVPAENLGLGEGLSPSCSRCLQATLRHIRALAQGETLGRWCADEVEGGGVLTGMASLSASMVSCEKKRVGHEGSS